METNNSFDAFVKIIERLRAEDGCPWDRAQTTESLRPGIIEEAYEVAEAIDLKDDANLCEELGDVLLQVVMHGVIAEETNRFTLEDVIAGISEKMIHRHPHVFGTEKAEDAQAVLTNWEAIKKEEKQELSITDGLKRVPKALPANIRAAKVQKKAGVAGFDFTDTKEVLLKVHEELAELEEALNVGEEAQICEEFGDLMFTMVNLSRFLHLNAENVLTNATEKFINRFESIENIAKERCFELSNVPLDQMNSLWDSIKQKEVETVDKI